ncbi:hypothetical protein HMI55_000182 [Coelomomyces lativittatus]|nr:hypothetical protein HMI55_000182 [Coelomomyces lativittatus]
MDLPKFTEEVESLLLFTEFTEFLRKDGYLDDILFLKRIIDYVAYYNSLAIQFPPNSFTSIPPSPETSLPLTKTTSFRVFSQLHSYAKVILVHYCLPSQELTSQVPPRLTLLKPVSHWTSFSRNLCLTRAHTKELELNSAIFKLSEQLTQPYSTDPFISFHPSIFKPSFNIDAFF